MYFGENICDNRFPIGREYIIENIFSLVFTCYRILNNLHFIVCVICIHYTSCLLYTIVQYTTVNTTDNFVLWLQNTGLKLKVDTEYQHSVYIVLHH